MRRHTLLSLPIVSLSMLLMATAVNAETIYLATGTGIDQSTPAGPPQETLYSVDSDTCAVTTVGSMGTSITSMDFDASGNLFGILATNFTPPYEYYQIDTGSGAASLVMSLNDGAGGDAPGNFPDMTFRGSELFAFTENGDDLTSIDTGTGAVTVLGDAGFGDISAGSGTAADSSGTVWVLPCSGCGDGVRAQRNNGDDGVQGGGTPDALYTVDTTTGVATEVVQVTGENTARTINAMDFASDDTLWAIEGGFCFDTNCEARLVTVDTGTGAITEVCGTADLPLGLDAMTVAPAGGPGEATAVPAMNRWMLLGTALLLVSIAGFAGFRRART